MNHSAVHFFNLCGPSGAVIIDLISHSGNLEQALHLVQKTGDRVILPTISVALNVCRKGAPQKSRLITGYVGADKDQIHAWMEMEVNGTICCVDVSHIPEAPIQIVKQKTFNEFWKPSRKIQVMSLRQLGIKVDNIWKKEIVTDLRVDGLAHVILEKTIAEIGKMDAP